MKKSYGLLVLVVLCVLSLWPAEAKKPQAVSASKVSSPVPVVQLIPVLPPIYTTYDVYVGGLHLVAAQVWFEEQGSTYHAVVKASTTGLWGRFVPWKTYLEGHGQIVRDRLVPQEFFTRDEWAHKPKITKLHFDGKGGVTPEFDPPSHDENREVVTDEQRHGSLDPITALLQMLAHVAVQKSCAIPVPVFDGKRRFDIEGRDAGSEDIEDPDYNIYAGKAHVCDADFKMISGEWKDREHARFWQKSENEAGRDPFHIWLAPIAPGLPDMPVRMETGSIAGLVVIHLSSWRYATTEEVKAQTLPE